MIPFASVRPEDGFDHWHQVTCRNYSLTQCRSVRDEDFRATVSTQTFGELALSNISSRIKGGSALKVQRGALDIRRDDREEIYFWVGRAGRTMLEQQGRISTLGPGDVALLDQAKPFSLTFGEVSASTMIIVQRPLMAARLPWAENAVVSKIPASAPWTRLFVSVLDHCLQEGSGEDWAGMQRLSASILDMWSGVAELALENAYAAVPRQSRRLSQVQDFLRAHLSEAELDTATIAQAMNMSARTLMRLFAEVGTTPMRWLLEERLRASHQALSSGRFDRVTDAALAYGFCSLSHFSRVFKARHGLSPQALLRSR